MASTDDPKSHALSNNHDFYDLLGLQPGAQETEVRRAYRKTALKYHPDKVGASQEALDKFHLLQIAYDVLSDGSVRELYDNARRARKEKKQRDAAYEGRRKWMKEDLERRENGALKRKRDETAAEEEFERELRRIAEDGKRRRKEREEQLRREAMELEEEDRRLREGDTVPDATQHVPENGPSDVDRSISLRFQKDASQHDQDSLISLWSKLGLIDHCLLKEKKVKPPGEKHRKEYITAVIVYHSIVGAHAAISDISKLQASEPEIWSIFEGVGWAGGKEPDCVPKLSQKSGVEESRLPANTTAQSKPVVHGDGAAKKVPKFSFKGSGGGGATLDENLMMRLKNAEKKRQEKMAREADTVA